MTDIASAQPAEKSTSGIPAQFAAMLVVAGVAYLIAEFVFNMKLLEVAGGSSDEAAVHRVEIAGRILSGFGLALLFLKSAWFQLKFPVLLAGGRPAIVTIAITVGACVGAMFSIQTAIIDGLTSLYDNEDRRRAAALTFVTRATSADIVELTGAEALDRSELLVYRALLPFMQDGLSAQEAERVSSDAIRVIVTRRFQAETTKSKTAAYGSFVEARRGMQANFNAYLDGEDALAKARASGEENAWKSYREQSRALEGRMSELPTLQAQKWDQYLQTLRKRNVRTPVGSIVCSSVRTEVRRQLPPIATNWNCNDRGPFDLAVEIQFENEALESWNRRSRQEVGAAVPPGLSRSEFFAHPAIQTKFASSARTGDGEWDKRMTEKGLAGLPRGLTFEQFIAHPIVMTAFAQRAPDAARVFKLAGYSGFPNDIGSPADFERKILNRAIAAAMKEHETEKLRAGAGLAPADTYAADAVNAEIGRKAVQAMVGPPLALLFSLFFFFVNLGGLVAGLLPRRIALAGSAAAILGAILLPLATTNELIRFDTFQSRLENVEKYKGPVAAAAMTWLAHAQPLAHRPFATMLDPNIAVVRVEGRDYDVKAK